MLGNSILAKQSVVHLFKEPRNFSRARETKPPVNAEKLQTAVAVESLVSPEVNAIVKARLAESTQHNYISLQKRFIQWLHLQKKSESFTPEDVLNYLTVVHSEGKSFGSVASRAYNTCHL